MAKIGVFICWCGENIARTVDVEKVTQTINQLPGVVHSDNYKYMCSDPGQNKIKDAIKIYKLDGVVVAACSPHMHEITFRNACAEAGLNPYLCEMANIREHCSWVHDDKEKATEKAIDLIKVMVNKVMRNSKLFPIKVPIEKTALVIGGGIAGIQSAIDIANAGHKVIMVEKEPSIGGHMSQLSETFPTLDCSQCILTPRMVECFKHPNITVYTYSEVENVDGYVGNFNVKIRKKAKFVDHKTCTGCGDCWNKCPQKKIPNEFDMNLSMRTAIYVPFPQAVPNKPVIDKENCIKLTKDKCGICEKICPPKSINYQDKDEIIEVKVGAIVAATGYTLYSIEKHPAEDVLKGYGEYGYGIYPDVIDGLQFERLASASGPTSGEIRRISDGKEPETVVFIKCVGSRDNAKGIPYCSKICCMYTAKHAMLYKHKVHHGKAYVFYMDIRSNGKDYDEFVRRAIEEDGVMYIRGRVSKIYRENGKYVVKGADTLTGEQVEIRADMVVLATAMVAQEGVDKLCQKLRIPYNQFNFMAEAHPKLKPVETNTAGIYLAGCCQFPKDIPETVAQASGAAAKVLGLFANDELERSPVTAIVNRETCVGCFMCEKVCPYNAIEREEIKDREGNVIRVIAKVNKGLCQGCGPCVAICPSKSIDLEGFTDEELYAEINTL